MIIIIGLMIIAILILDRGFYNIARYRDMSSYHSNLKVRGIMGQLGPNELAVCLAMYTTVIVAFFSSLDYYLFMWIERPRICEKFHKTIHSLRNEVLILRGARQVGKTSFLLNHQTLCGIIPQCLIFDTCCAEPPT